MSDSKITLGQIIDKITEALQSVDEVTRKIALTAVCSQLKIELSGLHEERKNLDVPLEKTPTVLIPHAGKRMDIFSLKEQKKPKNGQQMACVIAYYLQEYAPDEEKKEFITSEDLEKFFKQARFPLPKQIQQVLVDGKKGGYFDSTVRGEYKLTPVGYNLVAHNLPTSKKNST